VATNNLRSETILTVSMTVKSNPLAGQEPRELTIREQNPSSSRNGFKERLKTTDGSFDI